MTTVDWAMRVTGEQIEALMAEAGVAGDELQVAVCLVALGRDDERVLAQRRGLERLGIIPEHVGADISAAAECAHVCAAVQS